MKPDTLGQLHGNSPRPVSAAEALKLIGGHFGNHQNFTNFTSAKKIVTGPTGQGWMVFLSMSGF